MPPEKNKHDSARSLRHERWRLYGVDFARVRELRTFDEIERMRRKWELEYRSVRMA